VSILTALFWISVFIVLYSNFGYLLLVGLWSKLFPKPVKKDVNYRPYLSIIIPAHNEEDVIVQKIENTLALDYPSDKFELIIISDGSTDSTNEKIARYRDLRIRSNFLDVNQGKSKALMAGIEMAKGTIIVLTDADSFISADALKNLAPGFADPKVGVIVGRIIIQDDPKSAVAAGATSHWKFQELLRQFESLAGSTVSAAGVFHAVRKNLFPPLPENVADDQYILLKALERNHRVICEPDACAITIAPTGIREEFRRKARIHARQLEAVRCLGKGLFRFNWQDIFFFISHKICRWLVPWCLIGAFFLNLLLLSNPFYLLLFYIQVIFYGIAMIGLLMHIFKYGLRLLIFPFYFLMANIAVAFGAARYVLWGAPSKWNSSHIK
jgi:cellulose synthase/poly-beta-1,6-N-acetylglucosamine synthase-like glycosyltransferase